MAKQNLGKFLRAFIREESGQSTTEYILILAVVVMIAMKFKEKVGALILGRVENISGELNKFDQM
jgi:Flp pilus assembly pilin Flp